MPKIACLWFLGLGFERSFGMSCLKKGKIVSIRYRQFIYSHILFLGVLLVLAAGCTPKSPHLRPLTDPAGSDPSKRQVLVDILPIDTFGFGNAQKKRFGMDISRFFTAFEVEVKNRTDRPVEMDPLASVLTFSAGQTQSPLSMEEALRYYRETPRTVAAQEREEAIIRKLTLTGQNIQPGEAAKGIIYFTKVPPGECRMVKLALNGVRVSGEEQGRLFRFEFLCPSRP